MKRLIVAITGASGAIYGVRALQVLCELPDIETHLILSPSGSRTITEETCFSVEQVRNLAYRTYNYRDIGAPLSSGSFRTEGMLIAPCSVKTLSGIAHCFDDHLVVRAADVCLKERRRVVLLFRETPLHAGHIEMMAQATRNGAIVMPPVPAFYAAPASVDDIVTQTVGRALDLFGIDGKIVLRWREEDEAERKPLPPNSPAVNASDSAFWRFSLEFYRRPAVRDACLALQDLAGADVNLVLFLLFLARQGRRVTCEDVPRMDTRIEHWRTDVVKKLRAVRRQLKHGVTPVAAEQAAVLRAEVARVELEAERLQQFALEAAFPAATTGTPDEIESAVRANLDTCLAAANAPADAVAVLIAEFADFTSSQHR